MVKIATQCINFFFVCINVAKFDISVRRFDIVIGYYASLLDRLKTEMQKKTHIAQNIAEIFPIFHCN